MQRISTLVMLGLLGTVACEGGGGLKPNGTSGGGVQTQDVCQQTALANCERISRCAGGDGLATMGYASVAECATGLQDTLCKAQPTVCRSGQTYHADVAQSCVDALRNLSCESHTAPNVCNQVCTDSPSGGGTITKEAFCQQVMASLCEKAFACGPDSDLANLTRPYASIASCTSAMQADYCPQALACDSGETYHGDQAKRCVDAIPALSCANLGDEPPECKNVCSASDTGDVSVFDPVEPGLSARETCTQVIAALCSRCPTIIGFNSERACLNEFQTQCATVRESDMCPGGGRYRASQGLACVKAAQTASCDQSSSLSACESEALCE